MGICAHGDSEPQSLKRIDQMDRQYLKQELQEHLPFSIFFTAAGILLAAFLTYDSIIGGGYEPTCTHDHGTEQAQESRENDEREHDVTCTHAGEQHLLAASGMMFHILHPVHILLSAMATTAMFVRYERKLFKAAIVGAVGAVGVCGLSDVFMPYLSGQLLAAKHMHFHWCVLSHPQMVLPFVALGIVGGMISATAVSNSTVFSHSAHVMVSCAASLFYLISYGVHDWFSEDKLPYVFVVVVLCVTIPCCLSDILFPVLVAKGEGEDHPHGGHTHGQNDA